MTIKIYPSITTLQHYYFYKLSLQSTRFRYLIPKKSLRQYKNEMEKEYCHQIVI